MRASRFLLLAGTLSIALSLALYFPTFVHSYAYDDVDYLNRGARMLAGDLGVWPALFYPHNEHIVAGFLALFFPYLRLAGVNALVWRVGVVFVHALSAIFLAVIARRYAGSARAGLAAAVVYVGACGFSSMWIWFPTAAPVPLLMAMLTGAAALLAWRDHLTLRRLSAGALVVVALLTESAFAPMALLPAAIDEYERWRAGRRTWRRPIGALTLFTLAMIGSVAVVVGRVLRQESHAPLSIDLRSGVPRAAFLVLVAPFRFFFPRAAFEATPDSRFAILGCLLGCTIASLLGAALIVLWRRGTPSLAVISALTLPASLGVIALIGLGRWRASYVSLYATDRYFFPLLVPAALLAGAVANSVPLDGWPRLARVLFLLALSSAALCELVLQDRTMLSSIPRVVYARHAARFESLARLMALLDRAGPIEIPRRSLWFQDVHNGRLETAVLTELLCRRCTRVRLGSQTVDPATAERLNTLLDQWARGSGEPLPFLRVVKGRLVNTHMPWRVDFSQGAFADRVSGFYEWENPYRWMGARGDVTVNVGPRNFVLTLGAPLSELRNRFGWSSLPVRATLIDAETGLACPLGIATVVRDGVQSYSFPPTAFLSTFGNGRTARLVLECDRTWSTTGPGSAVDLRPRCVQVFAVGGDAPDAVD